MIAPDTKFERWTVVNLAGRAVSGEKLWHCKCNCGTERDVLQYSLTSGHSRSCGCLTREINSLMKRTHGRRHTPEYQAWCKLRQRCSPKASIGDRANYFERGIRVDSAWEGPTGFMAFFSHIGPRPSPQYSVDRIDNGKGYAPGNVRWATAKTQANNRRNKRIEQFTNEEIASEFIRRGLTIERVS